MLEASCHCGAVKVRVPALPESVTSCNCSACCRYAALWAYYEPKDVKVSCEPQQLGDYCWGDKTITFHHCNNCGCLTHYTPTDLGNPKRMAINFRMLTTDVVNRVKVRYFDGAETWQFLHE